MPDIVKKKKEIKDQISDFGDGVVDARTEVLENVQLGEEMRTAMCWAVTSNNLPYHSEPLAKQRAVLQGKTFADPDLIKFTFANSGTGIWGSSSATVTLPKMEDSSNTSFGVQAFWEEDGTTEIALSATSGTSQTINSYAYSTYVGDYFFARSRTDGSLVDLNIDSDPYAGPTDDEPFIPANTINGETYVATADNPTANTDFRYDYFLLTNATSHGHAGGGKDIGETKYTGNTFVNLTLVDVDGEFQAGEILKDSDNATSNVKSYTNTTTIDVDLQSVNGTFTIGETVTHGTTNATINTLTTISNTSSIIGANTFLTGSNTSYDLGFISSNTVVLGDGAVTRTGNTATVQFANGHGVTSGEKVVIEGGDDGFEEFVGTFDVSDSNTTHFSYETSNSVSVTPTGGFKFIKGLVVGLTSNAAGAIISRTSNNSATVVIQNINATSNTSDEVGFAVSNVVTGNTSSSTASISAREISGSWTNSYSNTVKTYDATNGTWNYDAANNVNGIPTEANTGTFWLKEWEAVNVASYTAASSSVGSDVNKIVLTKPLATASDVYGGYDATSRTFLPGLDSILILKTWADQTSGSTTFLEAYDNFAAINIVSEGLSKNSSWLPLGVGNNGTDITITGSVSSAHASEKVTIANSSTWESELGPYRKTYSSVDDIIKSANPEYRSLGSNTSYSNTSAADDMYPKIENSPFYPSVGGTQKGWANTSDNIRGTQPQGYGDEDIYAGQFFQFEQGRKFKDDNDEHVIDDYTYRYGIWADQKWALGVDPEETVTLPVSTGTGVPGSGPTSTQNQTGRKGPPANRFKEPFVENTSTLSSLYDAGPSFNSGTGGTFTLNTGTYPLTVPASSWPTSPKTFASTYDNPTEFNSAQSPHPDSWSQIGSSGSGQTITVYKLLSSFSVPAGNISGSSSAVNYPNIVVSKTYTATSTQTQTAVSPSTSPATYEYTYSYSWTAGSDTYFPCTYNEIQKYWRKDSGTPSGTSTDDNIAYLDSKLTDLANNPVDDPFEDGLSAAGNAPIVTDSDFNNEVANLVANTSTAKTNHNQPAIMSSNSGNANGVPSVIVTNQLYTGDQEFDEYWEDLYTFLNTTVPGRIAEITARIGYLDKMPPSSGGDSKLTEKSFANSSSGTQSFTTLTAPDSNFYSNPAQTAEDGGGWQGYAFKDTNGTGTVRYGGYMSQVFAAANVMAGKKVGFVTKIIDGIDDIDSLYTQITKLRAQYYEYHQGNSDT